MIPLPNYTPVFYNSILIIVLLAALQLLIRGYVIFNSQKKETISLMLLIGVILYMGLRPISGKFFGDMGVYNLRFNFYELGGEVSNSRDVLWDYFMKFCSNFMSAKYFFLLCAILYVLPLYKAAKNWLKEDRYFLFLMFIASFSFWAYGTNGIRNGIATSLFVLGLSYYKSKKWRYVFLPISYFIHGSMLIPIAAYALTLFYKKPNHYLLGWLLCIPLSLLFGSSIESFFLGLGVGGNRVGYLNMQGFEEQFSSTGFRWDFLVYSASTIFVGYYFIIKRKFSDKRYIQLFNIYVAANAFWVLMIRATFTNRFAYLSWFLMAVIIFYPFFKRQFFKKQQKVLAIGIILYFGFSYFMFLVT